MGDRSDGWSAPARALHWIIALVITITFGLGWAVDLVPRGASALVMSLHMHAGLAVAALMLVRLAWRLRVGRPPLLPMSPLERGAAIAAHFGLYVLVFWLALAGFMYMRRTPRPMELFGVFEMSNTDAPETSVALGAFVHTGLGLALLGLLAVHVGAALWRHFVVGDETLRRMMGLPSPPATDARPILVETEAEEAGEAPPAPRGFGSGRASAVVHAREDSAGL